MELTNSITMILKVATKTIVFLTALLSIVTLITCKKEEPKLNLVLYDKPLAMIKSHVQGRWWLKRVTGGICSNCGAALKNNPYMIITGDRIVSGNDLKVTLDTIIVWKRDLDIFKDSTYLLSYRDSKSYPFPIHKIVDRIENSQLILIDNAYDPFYYYYAKE